MSYVPIGQDSATTTATQAALQIAKDPYLKEAACEVFRLSSVDKYGRPGAACPRTPRGAAGGIGLRHAVGPLRLFIWHKQYPWAIPLAGITILGMAYLAGIEDGRKRR